MRNIQIVLGKKPLKLAGDLNSRHLRWQFYSNIGCAFNRKGAAQNRKDRRTWASRCLSYARRSESASSLSKNGIGRGSGEELLEGESCTVGAVLSPAETVNDAEVVV